MGKRRKTNQGKGFVILLFILSLAGTGCGDSRQAEEKSFRSGSLSNNYFFEEGGIVLNSGERFLYSDWEPVEFDYICMDPTCSHLNESCSAHTIQDESSRMRDFCLIYQDRLIILHAYFQLTINEISETAEDLSTGSAMPSIASTLMIIRWKPSLSRIIRKESRHINTSFMSMMT